MSESVRVAIFVSLHLINVRNAVFLLLVNFLNFLNVVSFSHPAKKIAVNVWFDHKIFGFFSCISFHIGPNSKNHFKSCMCTFCLIS